MMRRIGQRAILAPLTAPLMAAMLAAVPAALLPGPSAAGNVPVESQVLGQSKVTLHVYPFLDPTELATLRLVMTSPPALALFLPKGTTAGYAAIAVAPGEGFLRGGKPVPSAVALGGLRDAATAATQATRACDARRKPGGAACVVVLEVAPKG